MITKKRKEKKDSQDLIFPIILLVLLVGIVGFLIVSNYKISKKRTDMTERIESLRREIQAVEEKTEALKSGLSQVEDDAYWEEKMREQGYKKSGEEAVVVLPPENKTEESTSSEKGFWDKFKEKLGF